jgi:hypothetical protein
LTEAITNDALMTEEDYNNLIKMQIYLNEIQITEPIKKEKKDKRIRVRKSLSEIYEESEKRKEIENQKLFDVYKKTFNMDITKLFK